LPLVVVLSFRSNLGQAKFPAISYADLYTYAGVVAVEESNGPKVPFRLGRADFTDGSTSPTDPRYVLEWTGDRALYRPTCSRLAPHPHQPHSSLLRSLPDADKGSRVSTIQHVRDVFYRMGFTDQEIVALLGAHAMGRCHTTRSGYWGPWTNAETSFSNEYFRLLLEERWSPKTTHNGKPWTGPDQYEDSTGQLMMLPSDIALIADPAFKKWVEVYAKDEDRFYKDFARAFGKLLELGVPFAAGKPWYQFW
jgi:cytochrome c peroxidase